jgi:PleD family two-component response regulator
MKNALPELENTRILIVDDNQSIHSDFKKILISQINELDKELSELENALLNGSSEVKPTPPSSIQMLRYQIDSAYQGEEAIEKVKNSLVKKQPYALIFMDVRMPPGMNGIDAIEKIWEIDPEVEVVICTAYSDYSWDEIVKKTGSTDKLLFLKKPFYSIEVRQIALSLVIKYNLNIHVKRLLTNLENDIKDRTEQLHKLTEELKVKNSDLEDKNRILSNMVERDGLTGLYNHAAFHRRLSELYDAAKRHLFSFCIVMIDVDNFKLINDTYGHIIGDEVLKKITEVISREVKSNLSPDLYTYHEKANVRRYDIAARYGGDEFGLIFPYCNRMEIETIVDRLNQKIGACRVSETVRFSCCIGVAIFDTQQQCSSYKILLNLADKALQNAKNKGINITSFSGNAQQTA